MPTRRTVPAMRSGIRNSWPGRTRADRPDSLDHTSAPPPARPPRPPQPPESPKPECASEPLSGWAGPIGLQLRFGVEIGVGVAIGIPAGGRRLALLVARKGAVTETRKFIALNAKRIAGADSLCRRAANHRQSTGGQQSKSDVTHENLSSAAAVLLIDSLRSNPSRSRGFPSTHDVAHDGGRGHGKLGRSYSRFVQQRQDTPFLLVMPGLVPRLSGWRGTKCPAGN